jgi:hypothetical protein
MKRLWWAAVVAALGSITLMMIARPAMAYGPAEHELVLALAFKRVCAAWSRESSQEELANHCDDSARRKAFDQCAAERADCRSRCSIEKNECPECESANEKCADHVFKHCQRSDLRRKGQTVVCGVPPRVENWPEQPAAKAWADSAFPNVRELGLDQVAGECRPEMDDTRGINAFSNRAVAKALSLSDYCPTAPFAYQGLHWEAMSAAARNDVRAAFELERHALHFYVDLFAAGHIFGRASTRGLYDPRAEKETQEEWDREGIDIEPGWRASGVPRGSPQSK